MRLAPPLRRANHNRESLALAGNWKKFMKQGSEADRATGLLWSTYASPGPISQVVRHAIKGVASKAIGEGV